MKYKRFHKCKLTNNFAHNETMFDSVVVKKTLRAFEEKDFGFIQSLILHGKLDPNDIIPSKGVTLLHLIIGHQSENYAFRVTKLFLRFGGDPNIQSSDGVTPTHVAAAWGRNRILHLLLVNGGDPWIQDDEKKNAFNYAFEMREWNTIEMLHHFQQVYSAAYCRQEVELTPKFQLNLERVLLRKGDEMFAYGPSSKIVKSMTTQTPSDLSDASLSPVQDKIRYFEPDTNPKKVDVTKNTKKQEIEWSKDFYQTSCEVLIHCDPSGQVEEPQETYVSSVHINTSDSKPEKSCEMKRSSDVRGQLFEELQEAVRRRHSKTEQEKNLDSDPDVSQSILRIDSPAKDPFVAREVSYLYGVDLQDGGMLKSMSDFATKVMKEIEIEEDAKTVDLCASSPDLSKNYVTCCDESEPNKPVLQTVATIHIPPRLPDFCLTPYDSAQSGRDLGKNESKDENSNESFMSVSEEYKYTDAEEGVVLLEKKLLLTPAISLSADSDNEVDDTDGASEASSTTSTLPSSISYNSDVLRCDLKGLGYDPGPITKTTKKLYLRKLWRLKKKAKPSTVDVPIVRSSFLEKTIVNPDEFEKIPRYGYLEEEMCHSFENWAKRKWREGTNKTSFNYLLLDPRISMNLPKRALGLAPLEAWKVFLSAVFYVGKGKRSRPYAHLYQATAIWEKRSEETDKKTKRIIDIWKEGLGVVCLHIFQNIIPVEAFTREAAMIDALKLSNIKNAKNGEYYGVVSTWPTKNKVKLGIFLLHKAMMIFLNEGERQIKPYDID